MKLPALRDFPFLWIVAFVFFAAAGPKLPGQDTNSTVAAQPRSTLAELAQHRNLWPAQVTLKAEVKLTIISNGRVVGSTVSPEGSIVDLVSVSETGLQIKVMAATATIPADQTDLWTQVAALSQKSPAVATSPAAAATPPASTTTNPPPAQPTTPSSTTRSLPPQPGATSSSPSTTRSLPPQPSVPVLTPLTPVEAPTIGDPVQFDFEVKPRENFTKAAFRFWSPSYKDSIRGVIVLVPGLDGDGLNMVADDSWQALAQKYRLALVSCFLKGGGEGAYYDAPRGTGQALLEALKDFAAEAKRPEVEMAPLFLYGESAGGQFNYDFVLWKPERVACFVVNKGGFYNDSVANENVRSVPGLFILGMSDDQKRIDAITKIWKEGRDHGAVWALAPQPGSGHEFSQTPRLARAFFEPLLKTRLPDSSSLGSNDPPTLNIIPENKGWLGDLTTHEIHDESTDPEPDLKASWLPNQSAAQAWKDFVAP
jgi:hypothetical protein